jgi:hypothetical protein
VARAWQGRLVRMKVICASCEREGKPAYLGECEPYDNPATTHGLCQRHKEQALEALPAQSFPDAEMLMIVRPADTDLYEYLLRRFAGVRGVRVILERRQPKRPADEAQHKERRIPTRHSFRAGLHRRAIQTEASPLSRSTPDHFHAQT